MIGHQRPYEAELAVFFVLIRFCVSPALWLFYFFTAVAAGKLRFRGTLRSFLHRCMRSPPCSHGKQRSGGTPLSYPDDFTLMPPFE